MVGILDIIYIVDTIVHTIEHDYYNFCQCFWICFVLGSVEPDEQYEVIFVQYWIHICIEKVHLLCRQIENIKIIFHQCTLAVIFKFKNVVSKNKLNKIKPKNIQ